MANGKFHGVMAAATPIGIRTDMVNLSGSSEGVVWAEEPSPLTGDIVGRVDGFLDVATGLLEYLSISRVIDRASSSLRRTMISAARNMISARRGAGT